MLNRFCRQFLLNKELGITLLSYVSIFFSGIITIKVFTYLLSPKDYGQLGLISSLSSLFITTLVSPFMQSASRYFVHSNPILSFKYVNRYIKKIELIFIVCILILAIYLFLQREVLSSI
jgi:O-antigen/teichoic acid export membrane protein